MKIHDKVEVIAAETGDLGRIGKIVSIQSDWTFSIEVLFNSGKYWQIFKPSELKVISEIPVDPI